MMFVSSPTELTTSVTDLLLAIESLCIFFLLPDRHWQQRLWRRIFALLAFSSLLGAIAHGLDLSEETKSLLWKPLYLSLGIMMALFFTVAIAARAGDRFARHLLPFCVATGLVFYGLTEWFGGNFLIFTVYEAIMMLGALWIYGVIAVTRKRMAAGIMSVAIGINLLAAGVQGSSLSFPVGPIIFDHNGLFHLIQMIGLALLGLGASRISAPDDAKAEA